MSHYAGIVIGCYQYPKLVEAQIRLIRLLNFEDTPILLAGDGGRNAREKRPFLELAAKYPGVEVRINKKRHGHYKGDLEVFRQGLQWAFQNQFFYMCKLSQRFFILREDWLHTACLALAKSEHTLLGNKCEPYGLRYAFPLRTEAVIMDAEAYYDTIPHEAGESVERTIFNLNPHYLEWDLVSTEPGKPQDEVLWRQANSAEDYREICRQVDIELDPKFDCLAWHEKMGYKR